MTTPAAFVLIASLGASTLPAAVATEQPAAVTPLDEETAALVAALDAPSFAERERASLALVARAAGDELAILSALQSEQLSAEQRYRLLEAYRRVVVEAPRGAIGIEMRPDRGPGAGERGVKVMRVLPDMPAAGLLEVSDRIVGIEGQPIRDNRDVARLVQVRRPGERVVLAVRRPRRDADGNFVRDGLGQVIEASLDVEIALGSASDLQDPASMSERVTAARTQAWAAGRRHLSPPVRRAAWADPIDEAPDAGAPPSR